jgi:hypothetical protein
MSTLGDGAGFPQLRGRVLARERPADGRCPVSALDLSAEAAELREIITGLRAEAAARAQRARAGFQVVPDGSPPPGGAA